MLSFCLLNAIVSTVVSYPPICTTKNCVNGECEITSPTTFICHCKPGYTGDNCNVVDTSNDPCVAKPCWGVGSTCIKVGNPALPYVCSCVSGRGGKDCQYYVNSVCKCQNGACSSVSNGVLECRCNSGYGGFLCQYSLPNPCATLGCRNGATCENLSANTGICRCPAGFSGALCEIASTVSTTTTTTTNAIATCSTNPCANGGQCLLINNQVNCLCLANWTGPTCTTAITTTPPTTTVAAVCTPNPCKNSGFCLQNGNTYSCLCIGLFTGPTCEVAL